MTIFYAFRLADGVTAPNIIQGTRGFFVLIMGAAVNRYLKVPYERQTAWSTDGIGEHDVQLVDSGATPRADADVG